MLDILYNAYNGNIICSMDRASNEENVIKCLSRQFVADNPDTPSHLSFMPGSEFFPFVRPYQCNNCNHGDNDGCCKVITVSSEYQISNLRYNYRVDVSQTPNVLIKTHDPSVKFYNADNNEEYVYDSSYKAFLFRNNVRAVISFNCDGNLDTIFHNKIIKFDITNAISAKTLTTVNGVADVNIIFPGNSGSGKIVIAGEYIGNNLNYCPTNILSVNYVYIRG